MEYQYPIDYHWTTDETVEVIHFFQCIETAYEKGIDKELLMNAYRRFKVIVPASPRKRKYVMSLKKQVDIPLTE